MTFGEQSDLVARLLRHQHVDKGIHFPDEGTQVIYADLAHRAGHMMRHLTAEGAGPGDAIGILASSGPEFVIAVVAILGLGAAVVPLPDPDMFRRPDHRIEPLARMIDEARVRAIVVADPHADLARLLQIRRPNLRLLSATQPGSSSASPAHDVSLTTPALIQFNSGPVLAPRGVVLSHRAVAAGADTAFRAVGADADDRVVIWMPLSFDMGLIMLLGGMLLGADVHVMPTQLLLRRPESVLEHLHRARITICGGPNVCYERLTAAAVDSTVSQLGSLASLRAAVVAGEVVDPSVIATFAKACASAGLAHTAITPAYGLAEATLMVTCTPPGSGPVLTSFKRKTLDTIGSRAIECEPHDDDAMTLVAAGRPAPGVEVRVAVDGTVADVGEIGEIQASGPTLMNGYTSNEVGATAVFDGPWLRTGDLGFLHNGDLYICGRKKAMAIAHGRNIYASDVETIALESGLSIISATAVVETHTEEITLRVTTTLTDSTDIEQEIQRRCALILGFRSVRILIERLDTAT